MKKRILSAGFAVVVGFFVSFLPLKPHSISSLVSPPTSGLRLEESYGRLPLYFEPNQGQADPQVQFISRGSGYNLFLTSQEAVLVLNQPSHDSLDKLKPYRPSKLISKQSRPKPPTVMRMRLVGANPHPTLEGFEKLPGISNYFIGNDPSKWRANIPRFAKIRLKDVYPGVDMVYYGNQRHLEYDFIVAPRVDPKKIQLAWKGPKGAQVNRDGNLVLKTKDGQMVFKTPVIYQMKNGARRMVPGCYAVASNHRVGFKIPNYDSSQPLVIDPQLDYSTYLGGSGNDVGWGITVDSNGNAYVTGEVSSTNFPTTTGAFQTSLNGSQDAFVAKLNSTGTGLIYSTYLGGNGDSSGYGTAVDPSGDVYVEGNTASTNFPTTTGVYQTTIPGGFCVFVTKLNSTGTGLVYSTYLGGGCCDMSGGIALDANGDAYVTGNTGSTNFPTTAGAFQTMEGGSSDVFVAKLNPTGTGLVYSTFLGGSNADNGWGIAVDSSGNAYVTGSTQSTNFPTTAGAFQTVIGGSGNAFVSKLNPTGTSLVYSTYLGGDTDDFSQGIAVDSSGNAYVTGTTSSTNFPTTAGAFQTVEAGNYDVFVTKLNPTGTGLAFSTYLGGNGSDQGLGINVDSTGSVYVVGGTDSTNFPTTASAFQTALGGLQNAFVTKLKSTGTGLVYSTYLGGTNSDVGRGGIAVNANGNVFVAGATSSTDFPTTAGVYQSALAGTQNAFITKFDVAAFNTPTPGLTPTPTGTPTSTPCGYPGNTCTPTSTFTNTPTGTPTQTPLPSYLGPNAPAPGTSFAYPSPATTNGIVSIAYDMEEGGTAQVLVWNESAELVADVSQNKWVGPQETTLKILGWARGVYFYRVVLHYDSGKTNRLPPDKFYIGR